MTDGVAGSFPGLELTIELGDGERAGGDLTELLRMIALGSFHQTIELGRGRGQHEQAQAPLTTGLLEDGGELTAALHLQSAQGKRQTTLQGIQEQGAGRLVQAFMS